MRKRFLQCAMLMLLILCGCKSQTKPAPVHTPDEVMQLYLEAVKQQDGLTMAEYTIDHNGIDFSISDEEAKAMGLQKDIMQKLYDYLLNFTYTNDVAAIKDTTAEIKLHIKAYDIQKCLSDIVKKKEESFQEINGDDLSEADKNQKIADIIVNEFKNAKRTYKFDVVFHLQLVENEWLINSQDEAKLMDNLFMLKEKD